jgi:hypothetical protein
LEESGAFGVTDGNERVTVFIEPCPGDVVVFVDLGEGAGPFDSFDFGVGIDVIDAALESFFRTRITRIEPEFEAAFVEPDLEGVGVAFVLTVFDIDVVECLEEVRAGFDAIVILVGFDFQEVAFQVVGGRVEVLF